MKWYALLDMSWCYVSVVPLMDWCSYFICNIKHMPLIILKMLLVFNTETLQVFLEIIIIIIIKNPSVACLGDLETPIFWNGWQCACSVFTVVQLFQFQLKFLLPVFSPLLGAFYKTNQSCSFILLAAAHCFMDMGCLEFMLCFPGKLAVLQKITEGFVGNTLVILLKLVTCRKYRVPSSQKIYQKLFLLFKNVLTFPTDFQRIENSGIYFPLYTYVTSERQVNCMEC